jgi:dienelactone hydrolase
MIPRAALALVAVAALGAPAAALPTDAPETGTVRVEADAAGSTVPERYRLTARAFEFTLTPRFRLRHSGVDVYDLTFPSPVTSGVPANDTVYAEYYVPHDATGKLPAAIVLDILDGQQVVARGQALWLAQNGAAALVVYMAHYGPRRPPGSKVRLLSANVERTMDGIRQTVLDCRCTAAWLAARPEIDPDRIGLVGTSLGSLVGGVAAAAEPRVKNVCLLLGGGGLVDAFYDHPRAKPYADLIALVGGKDTMKRLIAPVDPLTFAPQLKGKNLLMIAASRDDVVPPAAARTLWEATGRQRIVWVDSTHVGAAAYALPALREITAHIKSK